MSMQENRPRRIHPKQHPGVEYQHDADVVERSMRQQWRDAAGLPLLPDEQPISTVRDSLYDLIPLGPREERLISTAPFLRLQKIKQLGLSIVYGLERLIHVMSIAWVAITWQCAHCAHYCNVVMMAGFLASL